MTLLSALLVALVLLFAGVSGAALLSALLQGEPNPRVRADVAFALGLPAGLVAAAMPGWLLSALAGIHIGAGMILAEPMNLAVLPLGGVALVVLLLLFGKDLPAALPRGKALLWPCGIFFGLFLFFLWLRLPVADIRQTEKPMDFAVLSNLMVTPRLPLQDPWMSGERFPYYHFGTLLFALPFRAAGVPPEYAYNLIAALLPAVLGLAAWGAVRSRRGGAQLGLLASLLATIGGTPDGLRQWLGGQNLKDIDFWASSRRVANAITEWPFFTYKLGDLHPHAMELPFLVVFAGLAGRIESGAGVVLEAVLLATIVSANPWTLPAALLVLFAGNLVARSLWPAISRSLATLLVSVPFLVPFLRSPRPKLLGLDFWPEGTTSPEGFLHFGALALVGALAMGIAMARSDDRPDHAFFRAVFPPALGIALAILMKRPVLGLSTGFLVAAGYLLFRDAPEGRNDLPKGGALRAGFLFLACGSALAAMADVVLVRDTYGEQLRRMNTIFKTWEAAWPLLAIGGSLLLPLVLATRHARATIRLLLAVALVATLVHPLSAIDSRLAAGFFGGTLDGLSWMARETPGDRKAVDWLRKNAPPGAVIAETTGNAYTDYGRIGTAAGRPQILGWANHEGLWRGNASDEEIRSRVADLRTIYTSMDPLPVLDIVGRRHIRYVVVGSLEKKDFGEQAFPTRLNFLRVFAEEGTAIYEARP